MFKPTLVTGAVYRAYGIEHPIGDPFGGPAYGQKEKGGIGGIFQSAIPIIAGAAMIIGSGGTLAPMVIGGAMMAGGVMSGIGAITGNNTLSKIGGITSAVAGVAGMGYGVYQNWDSISGFFANGTELAGSTAGAEAAATTGAAMDAGAGGGAALNNVNAPSVASNLAATPSNIAPSVSGAYNTEQLAGALGDQMLAAQQTPVNLSTGNMLASTQGTVDAGSAGANAIKNTAMGSVSLPGTGDYGMSMANGTVVNSAGQTLGTSPGFASDALPTVFGSAGGGGGGSTSSGLLSSVGNFIKENPVVSLMGLQTLGGLAEGASPKSQAEGEYLQAQTDYLNAKQQWEQAAQQAALDQTAANTEYLRSKAQEFERTKAYAEEKRRLYNESIINLQTPQTQNLAQVMQGGAQSAGLLNAARA